MSEEDKLRSSLSTDCPGSGQEANAVGGVPVLEDGKF